MRFGTVEEMKNDMHSFDVNPIVGLVMLVAAPVTVIGLILLAARYFGS
ncbi:MAG: hypothetical protein HQL54_11375 [Magnetococcales bacterium]|nr:hypothetical protein [Magnetococcales bacterium]